MEPPYDPARMFRRPLPAGPQAFLAWAMLGALITYGTASLLASPLVTYGGGLVVLRGLFRDTTEWRDALGLPAGVGAFLLLIGSLTIGYDACAASQACVGGSTVSYLVLGAVMVGGPSGLWILKRRGVPVGGEA